MRRFRAIYLGLVLIALGASWFVCYPNNQPTLRVALSMPMLYDPPRIPTPLIRLSINGAPPSLFVLSSAAPFALFIDKASAPALGLGTQTGWVSLQSVKAVDLLGNPTAELDIPRAYVNESNLGRIGNGLKIAGVVGANFFGALPVELNFVEKTITLYRHSLQEILEIEKDRVIAVKLLRPDPQEWVHAVEVSVPGHPRLIMQIATGSWISTLAVDDLKRAELAAIAPTPIGLGSLDTARIGPIPTFLGRLEWLSIDALKIQGVPFLFRLDEEVKMSRLGVDILALLGKVILDYRSGYLLVPRLPGSLIARVPGTSGLTLRLSAASHLEVAQVAPRSAAERAGFQTGDRVVAIGAHPVDTLSLQAAQLILDGYAGIPQRVQVMREGKVVECVLVPESPFKSTREAEPLIPLEKGTFGFSAVPVEIDLGGGKKEAFLLVTEITSDAARQAGLRVGDRIIAINSRHEWDESSLRELLRDSEELRLRVKHIGETQSQEIRLKRQAAK